MPNHSFEPTAPGVPWSAAQLKRWAAPEKSSECELFVLSKKWSVIATSSAFFALVFGFGALGCGFGQFVGFVLAPRFPRHALRFCLARNVKS
jgi:hypothetical protein